MHYIWMRNLIFQIILKNIEIYQDFSGGFLKYLEKLEFHYKVYVFIFNYKISLIFNFYMWILTVWYSYNVYLIDNWFLNIFEICFKFLHPEDILWFYLKYHKIFQYFFNILQYFGKYTIYYFKYIMLSLISSCFSVFYVVLIFYYDTINVVKHILLLIWHSRSWISCIIF